MVFNGWDWHIKSNEQYQFLNPIMSFLHTWRMPLLFMISGAGTWFALGFRTRRQYLMERIKRLLIPLAAGILFLVPVQVYIEKSADYNSLLDFYPHMFDGIYPEGNFSWHHLWFIAYLFFISMVISPFLDYFRSQKFYTFSKKQAKFISIPFGLNIFLGPLIFVQLLLRPYFPHSFQNLVGDWASIANYLLFFIYGIFLLSDSKNADIMKKQKFLFLLQTLFFTMLFFVVPGLIEDNGKRNLVWHILSTILGWSCSITIIGFARQYLNFNNKFRGKANEGIYPFYLIHQPMIIIAAALVLNLNLPVDIKAWLIAIFSLGGILIIYIFLIKPFNIARIMAGMKPLNKEKQTKKSKAYPVTVYAVEKDTH
jgi:hypothetical protein